MMTAQQVAAVQFCAGPHWPDNRSRLEALLPQAEGARLVLLPENVACYGGDYRQMAAQAAEVQQWLQQQARQLDAWVIAGSLPLLTRPDGSQVPAPRVRAAQLVVSPDGCVQARYDKLHLFDVDVGDAQGQYRESATFEPGNKAVLTRVADMVCGLAICFDVRFAALALLLAQQGAQLLVYPSAFTQKTGEAHWETLLRARAIETGCHVLAANQCGQHNARRASYGHSMLVDPWGRVVARLGAEPGVLRAEVDLDLQQQIRQQLPLLSQQTLGIDLHGLECEKQF